MIIVGVSIISALFGGWLGWRRGTLKLYSRSFDPLHPAHGGAERGEMSRRKRSRLMLTALYAIAGPMVVIGVLFVLVRR